MTRKIAQALRLLAEAFEEEAEKKEETKAGAEAEKKKEAKAEKKKEEKAGAEEETKEEAKAEPEKKEYTFAEVRKILAARNAEGLTPKVREIVGKYGAVKLSELDKSHYADVVDEVMKLKAPGKGEDEDGGTQ